jgi:hypothetical protein
MKGTVTGAWLASIVMVAAAGCDTSSGDDYPGPSSDSYPACSAYSACDTCTPVTGCGWCFESDGTGHCGSGRDGCTTSAFGWTWDPSGCHASGGDAGVAPTDAAWIGPDVSAAEASTVPTTDSGAPDTEPGDAVVDGSDSLVDSDAVASPDVGVAGGCAPNAGSLCGPDQPYGFTCASPDPGDSAIPAPPPSDGCTVAAVPTPSGVLFYCCTSSGGSAASRP